MIPLQLEVVSCGNRCTSGTVLKQIQGMGTRFSTRRNVLSNVKVDTPDCGLVEDVDDLIFELGVKRVSNTEGWIGTLVCLL